MLTNDVCLNKKVKYIKFSGILRYKRITQSRREDLVFQEEKNLSSGRFCCFSRPLNKSERSEKLNKYKDHARQMKSCET